jgi:ankyrin repeat protein
MDAAFEQAVTRGDVGAVRELLRRGADIDARDRHGQTALMIAAHRGHPELVVLLIEQRAPLDVTAKYGLSAVMLAIVAGHEEIARRIARAGADLSLRGTGAPGFAGRTARDLALARDMRELVAEWDAQR